MGGGVFKSTTGGGNWSAVNTGLTSPTVCVLGIAPLAPTTLYAGTTGGGVFALQQFNDYTLSSSGTITVMPGGSGSNTITATLTLCSIPSVTFALSGLPGGATASFNPTACTPSCSAQLTISTTSSTPTGTFPITVTGTPLGRTTMFDLVVNSACPVTTALGDAPDQKTKLAVVYDVRDHVLARTATGQRYVALFYMHAAEGVWLMLRHPDLRARSRTVLERLLPTLRALLARQPAPLTAADLAAIDALLEAFATNATAGLRADIKALRQELRQGRVLKDFGISIDGRNPTP